MLCAFHSSALPGAQHSQPALLCTVYQVSWHLLQLLFAGFLLCPCGHVCVNGTLVYSAHSSPAAFSLSLSLKIYWFLERGGGREKERDRNISVWLPLMRPLLGTWHATQAGALTRNWTRDPLVHRLALNPLSHTSQGCNFLCASISSVCILMYSLLMKLVSNT